MKLAIICQPSDKLLSSNQTPAAKWSYQVAGRLTADADTTIFGRKSSTQPDSIIIEESPFERGQFCLRFVPCLPDVLWTFFAWVWSRFAADTHPFSASRLYHLPYAIQIAIEIRRDRYDIVHIHELSPFVPLIRWFNPHVQIVLHVHTTALVDLDTARMQRTVDQCDRIFAVSDALTAQIHNCFPQTTHFCQTQCYGVDTAQFRPIDRSEQTSEQRILYVGPTQTPAFDQLLAAFAQVVQSFPDALFEVVCRGADGTCKPDALSAEWRDVVQIYDDVADADLYTYYQRATVVVDAREKVVFNIALVEAGACGIPTVAVRGAGNCNIVDDKRTGFLVERGRRDELAVRLCDLLRRANVCRQMGNSARKRVVRLFAWRKISRSVLYSYRALLGVMPPDAHRHSTISG